MKKNYLLQYGQTKYYTTITRQRLQLKILKPQSTVSHERNYSYVKAMIN